MSCNNIEINLADELLVTHSLTHFCFLYGQIVSVGWVFVDILLLLSKNIFIIKIVLHSVWESLLHLSLDALIELKKKWTYIYYYNLVNSFFLFLLFIFCLFFILFCLYYSTSSLLWVCYLHSVFTINNQPHHHYRVLNNFSKIMLIIDWYILKLKSTLCSLRTLQCTIALMLHSFWINIRKTKVKYFWWSDICKIFEWSCGI